MTSTASRPAFVLGLGVNGYGIVRSLGREGVPVVGIFRKSEEFGRHSRYCQRAHPAVALQDGREFCDTLIALGSDFHKPILFPTDDSYVLFLARHGETLATQFDFHWMGAHTIATIVDKAEMTSVCRGAGISVPLTHVLSPDGPIERLAKEFAFPCLIKPRRSFDIDFPRGMKNFVAESPRDLLDFYRTHSNLKGSTIWQEIIEGEDDSIFQCTALMTHRGQFVGSVCTRKVHQYPPGYGVMCFGRTEENRAVVTAAEKLLRTLGYSGVASIEFKYDSRRGEYYFIEMNPRLPWYNGLFVDAGVNLPLLAYQDLTQPDVPPSAGARQRHGTYWISLREDAGWYVRTRQRVGLLAWARSAARARSYAWWNWRDPRPFLHATTHLIGQTVRERLYPRRVTA